MQQSIRGAITADSNTENAIKEATIELVKSILEQNKINTTKISNVIFTMTKDLTKIYPAKVVRDEFKGFDKVPMMCLQELNIENSLERCIRIMITINTNKKQNDMKHIYLKEAKKLRTDING